MDRISATGMKTPAREAEPYFSQPVRQVLMMLIVTALVCAGGYLAYGRIFPIFLSSPWLNGVILGVFLIGVISCFWPASFRSRSLCARSAGSRASPPTGQAMR